MGCGIQFPVDYVTPSSVGSDDDDEDDDVGDDVDDDDLARLEALPGLLHKYDGMKIIF